MRTRKKIIAGFAQPSALETAHNEAKAAVAKARRLNGSEPSPEAWVIFAAKAANESMLKSTAANLALAEGEDDPEYLSAEERRAEARVAFMANCPLLTSRRNVQAYIACIAAAVSMTVITAEEGSKLMYIAQNALAAYREVK